MSVCALSLYLKLIVFLSNDPFVISCFHRSLYRCLLSVFVVRCIVVCYLCSLSGEVSFHKTLNSGTVQ